MTSRDLQFTRYIHGFMKFLEKKRPLKMPLHVYHNEATDWFVAESAEEAATLYKAYMVKCGATMDEDELADACKFSQCADDKVISIMPDEDQSLPAVSKMCAEWCASHGKGFLCSENF